MKMNWRNILLASAGMSLSVATAAAEDAAEQDTRELDAIIIVGEGITYSAVETTESMQLQQAPITSALAIIDNLPGVNVNEGDTFGFDDWSTSVSLRGFQTNLGEQQIGITIDGLPNGGSNYGGGAKANRYIDSQNLGTVEVSQGTADIASRSNDALGGTLNFTTQDALDEERVRLSVSLGEFEAQRFYGRYDTGLFLNDTTKAWISVSSQSATDWQEGSAQNERDHIAAKFQSSLGALELTGYASYDDTHEDNYQRIYSLAQFVNNPESDGLNGEWTGIPAIDQNYRRGWSTLRENFFAYLKADYEIQDGLNVSASVYRHDNDGRGDWVPPYLVDVVVDGAGNAESEATGDAFVEGGPFLGQIFYVDGNNVSVGADADGALAVQSYRHTHYQKDRTGLTADVDWTAQFGAVENTVRAGIWYEDATRHEHRDWHKISDTRVGFQFDHNPYYVQYSIDFPQTTFKWYVEDVIQFGDFSARIGAKQFNNEVERKDLFNPTDASENFSIDSESDVLLSAGASWSPSAVDGLEFFAGYAENYKAISDNLLEEVDQDTRLPEPETSENWEIGARYVGGNLRGSITYFDTQFENRIVALSEAEDGEIDYLQQFSGGFVNAGGIDSSGIEVAGEYLLNDNLSFFASYTYNDATYLGTGSLSLDDDAGIWAGNTVTGIPENMFVVSADWTRNNFYGGLSVKHVDDRFVNGGRNFARTAVIDGVETVLQPTNPQGSFIMDAYTLADLYVGVSGEAISDDLSNLDLRLTVNNLTDESYLGTHAFNSGAWLGAPRTVVFTMTADF